MAAAETAGGCWCGDVGAELLGVVQLKFEAAVSVGEPIRFWFVADIFTLGAWWTSDKDGR